MRTPVSFVEPVVTAEYLECIANQIFGHFPGLKKDLIPSDPLPCVLVNPNSSLSCRVRGPGVIPLSNTS